MSDPAETGTPRWSVVATVREPAALVLAFAAHHLALGAAEVWLFFDDPADPAAESVGALPGVRAVRCDEAHWRATMGGRSALQSVRQLGNATHAGAKTTADWILHADADEFLWCEGTLAEEIARLDASHGWLKLRNLERVWLGGEPDLTVFEGAFRRPVLPGDAVDPAAIYGIDARFLRMGFAGYPVGKAFVRTGRGYRLNVHAPRGRDGAMPPFRVARRVHLLHFDGLTPRHWAAKTLRYAAQPDAALDDLLHAERRAQVRYARDRCRTLEDVLALHARLLRPDPARAAALRAAGKLSEPRIDPVAGLEATLPGAKIGLGPQAFDAALGPEYAGLLAAKAG